ncbi:hypothetical protein [Rhodoblastus sp.]|uniref:hypothetical protein n=1 Tax=Rhodoblastus sp. TaxID=1962975 RepID=UPI0035B4472C
MSRTRKLSLGVAFASLGLAAGAPGGAALAQSQGPTAFGQEMPQQYFLNRVTNPAPPAASVGAAQGASASGAPGQGGAAQAAAADDDDGPGPFPKRYLLNKMFDSGR